MTRILAYGSLVLVSALCDIQVHFVEETFYDVDFSCFEDVPSLVISVIWIMNYQLFSLFFRSLRDVNQFSGINWNDKTGFFQHLIRRYFDQCPDIYKTLKFSLFYHQLTLLNAQIFVFRFSKLYLNILSLSCKLNHPRLMFTSSPLFQDQLLSIFSQTIITKPIHKFHAISSASIDEPKLLRIILIDRSKLDHSFLLERFFSNLKSKLKTFMNYQMGALRIEGQHNWQLRLYMIIYQYT
jgi:hypothetical protein